MEIFSAEVTKIKGLLEEWNTHPESVEVEATFGVKGVVDFQTFFRVVSRLQAKGYEAISQEDRITISLQNKIRFTLTGTAQVAQYCRDNQIMGKPFIAIIKDKNITAEKNQFTTIDLKEYDVRIKGRREIELSQNDPKVTSVIQPNVWEREYKFFRIIRRWTFKSSGVKFDLSLVQSTQPNKQGYALQRDFQDQNLFSQTPTYEIEVELDRSTLGDKDAFKTLIAGIGEVLRGIQGSPNLITHEKRKKVLEQYKELTNLDKFRGVAPITLEFKNFTSEETDEPTIRNDYNVTDKADGLRVMGFTNQKGELFMIDMAMNVYPTGLMNPDCRLSLLDGEYITEDKHGKSIQSLLFFDIYYSKNGINVTKNPFKVEGDCRYTTMNEWITTWNGNGGPTKLTKSTTLSVGLKKFYFATNISSIFAQANEILKIKDVRFYNTDGLIFTPNALPLPQGASVSFDSQFKWKPSEDNTIDFLVVFEKEENNKLTDKINIGIMSDTEEYLRYKTMRLFVGSREEPTMQNPRNTILYELPLPESYIGEGKPLGKYRPVLFTPNEYADTHASTCYLKTHIDHNTKEEYVMTERTEQPIRDLSIVEMRYDPKRPPGWRWIPIRIRADKTERLLRGVTLTTMADEQKMFSRLKLERTLNSYKTAMGVWNSIYNPITEFMITTGNETPSASEKVSLTEQSAGISKKYYERKVNKDDKFIVDSMRKFHNQYIKDDILYDSIQSTFPNVKLLDVAVGRANDIHRWKRIGANFVLGIDAVSESIINPIDGAYKRYLNELIKYKINKYPTPVPTMFFSIGDSSLRLIDGSAGENDEERDILRSIFGRVQPIGKIPPFVQKAGAKVLETGADVVSCMYAIHYFFENSTKFNGFLQNIADTLKVGGYFVGTNFDGQAVFNLLRGTLMGKSKVGMYNSSILWEITKLYDTDDLPIDDSAFGIPIDVNFISIGMTHREYLVSWNLLVAKLKTIGCELLDETELKKTGLTNSTNMYDVSYDMAMKQRNHQKYEMNDVLKQFSFLNRWYIFKRTSLGTGQLGKVTEDALAPTTDDIAKVNQLEKLSELSAAIQGTGTQTQFTTSMVPDIAKQTAVQLEQDLKVAEETGDIEQLQILDREANRIQEEIGLQKTAQVDGVAAGTIAKNFIKQINATTQPQVAVKAAERTIPVQAPTAVLVDQEKYNPSDIFKFYENSAKINKVLELPEKYKSYAARHMAPNAPFRIKDLRDNDDIREYPSITHFLMAMKFKYASARKDLANLFSRDGEIHQRSLASRLAKQKTQTNKSITRDQDNDILLEETNEVETEGMRYLNTPETKYDPAKWALVKDEVLRSAIQQRLRGDKWFCVIVSEALKQNKYLLYDNDKTELGGKHTALKLIRGQNQYGRLIMQLAKEMPDELRACLTLPDSI